MPPPFSPFAAAPPPPQPAEREQDRWNLGDIYPGVDAWNADHAKVEFAGPADPRLQGNWASPRGSCGNASRCRNEVLKRYYRLLVYASELYRKTRGNAASLGLGAEGPVLGSKLTEARSFGPAEIPRRGPLEDRRRHRGRKPGLASTRQPLDDILRARRTRWTVARARRSSRRSRCQWQSGAIYTIFSTPRCRGPR
jgi:hypothetical protein